MATETHPRSVQALPMACFFGTPASVPSSPPSSASGASCAACTTSQRSGSSSFSFRRFLASLPPLYWPIGFHTFRKRIAVKRQRMHQTREKHQMLRRSIAPRQPIRRAQVILPSKNEKGEPLSWR